MAKVTRRLLPVFVLLLLGISGFSFPVSYAAVSHADSTSAAAGLTESSAPAMQPLPPGQPNVLVKGGATPDLVTNWQKVGNPAQTPGNFLYYTPSGIENAYGVTPLLNSGTDGTGVTISIVDAFGDPNIQSELHTFSEAFGLPTVPVHTVCVDGPCNYTEGITYGWVGEIALDVEWAHAIAPGATINLYIGSNNGPALYDAVLAAVEGTNGNGTVLSPSSIISMSWGSPENDMADSALAQNYPWLDSVFQLATSKNITLFASSGDFGAYDQSENQTSPYGGAEYPSTDPYVTAVGGTSLYLRTTTGSLAALTAQASYGYETAWSYNDIYGWGTGGGYSTLFPRQSWQQGTGLADNGARGAPDVAWDADVQTGVVEYVEGSFYIVGGTSVGSPSWSGSMALIDEKAGHSLGLITPALYSIFKDPSEYSKAFHDITVGNNDPNSAGRGWSPLTGLGTPDLAVLASYLVKPSKSLSVSVSTNAALGLGQGGGDDSLVINARVIQGAATFKTGTVTAKISSVSGLIATVALAYDPGTGNWTGTYAIKQTDPSGIWTVSVLAHRSAHIAIVDGLVVAVRAVSGSGSSTFSVGDGVNVFEPFTTSNGFFYRVGDTLPISAWVTTPDGSSNVTTGSFYAELFLGTPSGKVEGVALLKYNSTSEMWDGAFTINSTRDQGPWILSVQGTDANGNVGAPGYAWLNVGLPVTPIDVGTDSSSYLLGETMQIYAYTYTNSGAFTASVYNAAGGALLGTAPMSLIGNETWQGSFQIPSTGPVGFYRIVVTGNDGLGNYADSETLVRVAAQSLRATSSVTASSLEDDSTATQSISAVVKYPNGTSMKIGTVEAFETITLQNGTSIPLYAIPLTYQTSSKSFTGVIPLIVNKTSSFLLTGTYSVAVEAYDPLGNYGNATSTFQVTPVPSGAPNECPTGSSGSTSCSAAILEPPSALIAARTGGAPEGTLARSPLALLAGRGLELRPMGRPQAVVGLS